jgi:hypothetical protein
MAGMIPHRLERRSGSAPVAVALLLAMIAVATVQLAAFWPGIMIWDAIRQYRQSLSGVYDDWHPPAMNWLWRQLLPIHSGPAPMLVLQAALYWGGFVLLAVSALRSGRRWLAVAIGTCALLPIPFVLVGAVLKDSLMAGALLLASGLIAWRRADEWPLRIVAILLLVAAATLRFNAVPACLPLLVVALPAAWRRTWRRLVLTTALAAIPLLAALPVANKLLDAQRSGVELSLVIYDLGGIGKFAGVDSFPPVGVADPVAVNAQCYKPVSWDAYAWWGPNPCPIGFTNLQPAFTARHLDPYTVWAKAIAAHPVAYAEHRLAHFNNNSRFLVHDTDLPTLSLQTDPNPWNFQLAPSALRDTLGTFAIWSSHTPLGWPICWLALGLGVLVLALGQPTGTIALPLALSAWAYGMSYLPLSVASEVRYHFWTATGIALATVIVLADARHIPRLRLAIAFAPLLVVILLCVTARI